jgi:membrane protein YqaA with SNARE-associated domain
VLRKTYDWLMNLAAGPHAMWALAGEAFCEGVFFPIPPDLMLMPIVLADRTRAWRAAAICTISSVAGGAVGYSVGRFLTTVGHWILSLTGHADSLASFQHWYGQWGVLLLAVPVPYKLISIASGFLQLNFALFLGASLVIRGVRFFAVAALIRAYGPPIRGFIERRLAVVVSVVALLIIGLVLALRFVR